MYSKLDKTCLLAYPVVSNRRLEQKEVGRLTQMVAHPPLEGLSSGEATGSPLAELFPEILGEVRDRTTLDLYEVPVAEVEHVLDPARLLQVCSGGLEDVPGWRVDLRAEVAPDVQADGRRLPFSDGCPRRALIDPPFAT